MSTLKEIINGWKNIIFPSKEVENLAKKRIKICVTCPKFLEKRKICNLCKCYMPTKTRSVNSKCPLNKW